VDAEAKVEPDDARFKQKEKSNKKNKKEYFGKPNLVKLAKAVKVELPLGRKTVEKMDVKQLKKAISGKLRPAALEKTLKNVEGTESQIKKKIELIYRLVMSDTPKGKTVDELRNEIRKNIMDGVQLNGLNDVSKTQQTETKVAAAPTKEEENVELIDMIATTPGVMPGSVGDNPRVDSIKKGMAKVNNNQTFFTLNKGVTKMYMKLTGRTRELIYDSSNTSTEPTATRTTEGETKKTEQTPEEKEAEALDKKIDEFFAKLINKNKQSDQLSKVMRELNNRANLNQTEETIQNRLATLNDIITMKSGDSGDYKNGKRIGMIIAQLNGGPTIITYQEIGRALRNKNPKKGSQWSGVPDKDNFEKLREVFSVLPEFNAGFKKFFEAMNTDNDEKVDVNEFATMYLRAKLKKAVFDKTKIDDNFTKKTFDTMLKLFGIGEEGEEEEEEEEEEVETKTSGEFKVGDIVRNISAKGIGVGFTGKITKMKPKSADVTWTNGEKSTNKKLIQLEMVTPPAPQQPVKPQPVKPPPAAPQTEVSPPAPPPAPQTTFKVGDIVTSTEKSKKDKGLIGEIDGTTAHVFWEDGSDETDNKLTDLVKVTISNVTESKIQEIFNSYDTKMTDDRLTNGEDLKSLQGNVPGSQVFRLKDLFNVDGIAGFSRKEFRFLLTVREEIITNWERRNNTAKPSETPVPQVTGKKEPQRKRDDGTPVATTPVATPVVKPVPSPVVKPTPVVGAPVKKENLNIKYDSKQNIFTVVNNTAYEEYHKKLTKELKEHQVCEPEEKKNNN